MMNPDEGHRRARVVAVLVTLLAPAIAAVLTVAVLILLRDRVSLSFFYEVRTALILAHQFAGSTVASIASLRLPARRFRIAAAVAVFLLAAIVFAVSFALLATLATECRFQLT